MSTWLPEHWGNLSPEAQWSHCWPTTPGRHKHWPDSGLHEFPYEPSSEQWQAVDRKQERCEKPIRRSATGLKAAWSQNDAIANGPQVVSRIWFPIVYFRDGGSLEGRGLRVSHAAASWEELQIHHMGCQQQDSTRGCGRIRDVCPAESWEEADEGPRNPQRRGSQENSAASGLIRGITPTHRHSRDIRSGQEHSCRTRRRRSWENKGTGHLSCTLHLRHRRHRRCTLEGRETQMLWAFNKRGVAYLWKQAVSPVLTLTVGEGVVSWLAAVACRTFNTLTAQALPWGITHDLRCPSVVTLARCGRADTRTLNSLSTYELSIPPCDERQLLRVTRCHGLSSTQVSAAAGQTEEPERM